MMNWKNKIQFIQICNSYNKLNGCVKLKQSWLLCNILICCIFVIVSICLGIYFWMWYPFHSIYVQKITNIWSMQPNYNIYELLTLSMDSTSLQLRGQQSRFYDWVYVNKDGKYSATAYTHCSSSLLGDSYGL